jgi:hypothetical protein
MFGFFGDTYLYCDWIGSIAGLDKLEVVLFPPITPWP